ncbi:sensor histidine kinase [Leifsonia sp. McL0607]|uniref:sensor histidine kinase n=1 Tax=Leifsonia sp. McL0607 TaxID=3415672 RepID=UPI003CE873F7
MLKATVRRLEQLDLPLPVVVDEQRAQIIETIIREVAAEVPQLVNAPGGTGPLLSYVPESADLEFGALQSQRTAHPAESLIVADILFDTALPEVTHWAQSAFGCEPIEVVRVLHHVIWRRFPAGAIGYTEGLRQRLFAADRESRLRVSRDLHDRVAHGIAAAIQRVELGVAARDTDMENLDGALGILRDTLEEVRSIATDLRRQVGERTLEESLQGLVDENPVDQVRVELEVRGRQCALAPVVAEEAYLIALEAIRNAREHASSATRIVVSLIHEPHRATLSVTDDGAGFDSRQPSVCRGLGLHAMQERALALGGVLSIDSKPGNGTIIELVVPHLGAER